jgi:hypothetical protein
MLDRERLDRERLDRKRLDRHRLDRHDPELRRRGVAGDGRRRSASSAISCFD